MTLAVYTSDLHGNLVQYRKLVDYAIRKSAKVIIIGGDLAPKEGPDNTLVEDQRRFLNASLPEVLRPLRERLPDSRLFLEMGNDDCEVNLDILKKFDPSLYEVIHRKRINLLDGFDIIGYSYVPITPFRMKDWQKFDLSDIPPELAREYGERKRTNYRLNGEKSTIKGWKEFQFTNEMEKDDSIQRDLKDDIFQENATRTIYVMHAPPNKTNLDQVTTGNHVGSIAIRLFIEEHQPYLTLHGHIHTTVDASGSFRHQIRNTLCLSSGNHNIGNKLTLLVFDLKSPQEVSQLII